MTSLTIYHDPEIGSEGHIPDPHQDTFAKTTLGFWLYLMTDCVLFGSLFITYAVLHKSTFGGPTSAELFDLKTAFLETVLLLVSSVTCGFAVLSSLKNQRTQLFLSLMATFALGVSFLMVEMHEFHMLLQEGHGWDKSAFLSAFFTLIGTHGLHITFGLLWLIVMAMQIYFSGITVATFRRLVLFSMFWHFLDLIWIFIYSFVYLLGV